MLCCGCLRVARCHTLPLGRVSINGSRITRCVPVELHRSTVSKLSPGVQARCSNSHHMWNITGHRIRLSGKFNPLARGSKQPLSERRGGMRRSRSCMSWTRGASRTRATCAAPTTPSSLSFRTGYPAVPSWSAVRAVCCVIIAQSATWPWNFKHKRLPSLKVRMASVSCMGRSSSLAIGNWIVTRWLLLHIDLSGLPLYTMHVLFYWLARQHACAK